ITITLIRWLLTSLVEMRLYIAWFFFKWRVDHRHLHSFPTRRSSDLIARTSGPLLKAAPADPLRPRLSNRPVRQQPPAGRCSRSRSEEHTSELQSRGHLVCRRLLEKKKE